MEARGHDEYQTLAAFAPSRQMPKEVEVAGWQVLRPQWRRGMNRETEARTQSARERDFRKASAPYGRGAGVQGKFSDADVGRGGGNRNLTQTTSMAIEIKTIGERWWSG
jgi:hypothetical protein